MRKSALALLSMALLIRPAFGLEHVTEEAAKKFLSTHERCLLAVGIPAKDGKVLSQTFCVTELAFDKGTSNETGGCVFALFNIATDKMTGSVAAGPEAPHYAMSKKKCDSGGFEELLRKVGVILEMVPDGKPEADGHQKLIPSGYSVEDVLVWGRDTERTGSSKTVFLGALGAKYKSWYETATKKKAAVPAAPRTFK